MEIFLTMWLLVVFSFAIFIIDNNFTKNYKIVKFVDGTYALRRGYYWFNYFDLKTNSHTWWSKHEVFFFEGCKGTLEEVQKVKIMLGKRKKEKGRKRRNNRIILVG